MRSLVLLLTVLATPVLAESHSDDASDLTCANFTALDIEGQKEALAELEETGGEDGEVPPESLLAGEERITMLVALCADSPDAMVSDVDEAQDDEGEGEEPSDG